MTTLSAPLDRIPADRVHRPGTPGFDAARSGFDLSAIPSPTSWSVPPVRTTWWTRSAWQ